MTPMPLTDLVVQQANGAVLITNHDGICRAATLNATGYAVWQMIDGRRSIDIILADLLRSASWTPSVDPEVVAADVRAFIEELRVQGFLEVH